MADVFATLPEFVAWRAAAAPDAQPAPVAAGSVLAGVCGACGATTRFLATSGSLRESLACRACGCNARQRAAATLLLQAVATHRHPRVYATEQAGPFYLALRRRLDRVCGSEFVASRFRYLRLSLWLWRRGVFEWVRREDVTALSFGDGRLDAVVSLDVLEHVPDFNAALRGFARVLRPGGTLVLTVPFHADRAESRVLAKVGTDGSIEHLQAPEYHGDPLGHGVLCFHHFGWDLLGAMRVAGFAAADAVRVHDPANGLPEALWVLRARR